MMSFRNKILLFGALAFAPFAPKAAAQEAWTLERCVAYALANNISVRSAALQVSDAEQSITEAKDRFLPTLNASASESLNFGRGLTAQNTYADRNTTSFQWGASLSLPLFQGLSEYRQMDVCLLYTSDAADE